MSKKLIMLSGGMDSLAIVLEYKDKYGPENIISLGFNYGQRHFQMENNAAVRFCKDFNIERIVLDVPIGQIGGCSLVNHSIPVTNDMSQQRSTVVPMRNGIFIMLAASLAQVKGCDTIVHGACKEDYESYRDCRFEFFNILNAAIQAGITSPKKGSECIIDDLNGCNINKDELTTPSEVKTDWEVILKFPSNRLDIKIETPLIFEKKEETMARILKKYDVSIYNYSYSCYNGEVQQCGVCPACQERKHAFKVNNIVDPIGYKE